MSTTTIEVYNNGTSTAVLADPVTGYSVTLRPSTSSTQLVDNEAVPGLKRAASSLSAQGVGLNVILSASEDPRDMVGNLGGSVSFWLANNVEHGVLASNPTTPSEPDEINVNLSTGAVRVNGKYNLLGATADMNPTAILLDGQQAAALADETEQYGVLTVFSDPSNDDALIWVIVIGESAAEGSGDAEVPTYAQIKSAIIASSGDSTLKNFVQVASLLLEVDDQSALTQTTTNIRPVPGTIN